jgi:probable HAF family extracellular repeat protein
VLTDLGSLPGEDNSYAASINDRGEIAGVTFTQFGEAHVVLWADGATRDLGALPEGDALVTDLNNRRQIVGYASSTTGNRAFTWLDGVFTYLPELTNARYTFAWSINDRGEIAGTSVGASVDPSVLEVESGVTLHELGGSLRYDTVWRLGSGVRPIQAHMRVMRAVAGSGGQTPVTTQLELGVRLFRRIWGG